MNVPRRLARHSRRTVVLGFFLVSMLGPGTVQAQDKSAAGVLYAEGIALRASGKHDQAADRFRRSLAAEHRASTYLALASSLYELDKADEAMVALDAMFAEFGATMTPKTRERGEKALRLVEEQLGFGRVAMSAQEKGAVFVDGAAAGTLPLGSPLRVKAGPHSLRIAREGAEPIVRELVVRKGDTVVVEVPQLPAPQVAEPAPVPTAKVVEPVKAVVHKPGPQRKSPSRIFITGHVAFLAGIGTTEQLALLPPTTCGVYCLPALSLLAGVHVGLPLRRNFLIEAGAEYLHAGSTLNVAWERNGVTFPGGTANAMLDLEHAFALDGALMHAAMGANLPLGDRVRIEGRAGLGVFVGQSTESVSGQIKPDPMSAQAATAPVNVADVTERTATVVLPVVRSRLGVSFAVGRVWLGIAAEGVVSVAKGPAMCIPNLNANGMMLAASGRARVDELVCPDGVRDARSLGRLLLVTPAISLGGGF